MLEYDLTATRIFSADGVVPTEAEFFVITLALLLVKGVAYTEMRRHVLEFEAGELEKLATCIEDEVPLFTRDMNSGEQLRHRLQDFVGLRISSRHPTDGIGPN